MSWNDISADEAQNNPAYGFGGGLYVIYALVLLWCAHSAYIVFLDTDYVLTKSYGYENLTMADFTSFIQICLSLPFLYLAPKLHPTMPSVAVSCFSVNIAIWFIFGMITPRAIPISVVAVIVTLGIVLYLMRSARVNVTYLKRVSG